MQTNMTARRSAADSIWRNHFVRVMGLPALLAAIVSTTSSAEDLKSTQQLRALSTSAANTAVRKDLLSVLEPPGRISSGMRRRLGGIEQTTAPYGTHFLGLCRRDVLSLKYAPTDTGPKFEDQPLQPYGVEAYALYHIVRLPEAKASGDEASLAPWRDECNHITGTDVEYVFWFRAADDEVAAKAANVVKAAVSAVKAGKVKITSCDTFQFEDRTCDRVFLEEGNFGKISSVQVCGVDAGLDCYEIDLGASTKITIVANIPKDSIIPDDVISIKIEQFIAVT